VLACRALWPFCFVSAVVPIKRRRFPASWRLLFLPHLHTTPTGTTGSARILRISPRLPHPLRSTSVDQNAEVCPSLHRSRSCIWRDKRSDECLVTSCQHFSLDGVGLFIYEAHRSGKDNLPASVISIVHQQKHPNKPWHWKKSRYWGKLNPASEDTWVFGDKGTGRYLLKFGWFKIERHVLVKGTASPDDARLRAYWKGREQAKAKDISPRQRKLAQRQEYVCPQCGTSLFNGEELHVHHRKPKHQGGTDEEHNLLLVHLSCHQQMHGKGRKTDAAI